MALGRGGGCGDVGEGVVDAMEQWRGGGGMGPEKDGQGWMAWSISATSLLNHTLSYSKPKYA